jgi:excisionase family DNA binding protein
MTTTPIDSKRKRPAKLLTPKDAAELLELPQSTLATWRSEKRGPNFFKLCGNLVRYSQEDLDAWLEAQRVNTQEAK